MDLDGEESTIDLRKEHRDRLQGLLSKLLRTHNWAEACGVAAVLLQATAEERCPSSDRFKYTASMELLKRIGSDGTHTSAVISKVYELWMVKAGINLANKSSDYNMDENNCALRLESIVHSFLQGHVEAERYNARSLMQEHGYESQPRLNLIVGMIFYQLWYSSVAECFERRDKPTSLMELDNSSAAGASQEPQESEHHGSNFAILSKGSAQDDTHTSVQIEKEMFACSDGEFCQLIVADSFQSTETESLDNQLQGFYATSDGHETDSDGDYMGFISDVDALEKLEPWILPVRTRSESVAVALNDEYWFAVKCLRSALHSKCVPAALLPLIQLLLIGGQYKEALDEVEKFSSTYDTAQTNRLRAALLELVDPNNRVRISTYYEESLKRDPTCSQSLARLIGFHKDGIYASESLLESIALHLEATYPGQDTWKEFASCLLQVSQSEEDRMSECMQGLGTQKHRLSVRYNRIPNFFVQGDTGSQWKLRYSWWSTRHFSTIKLASEIAAGDENLLTYKAACASHMYGLECEYVVKVYDLLRNGDKRSLFSFLQLHMQNSVGLHLCFKQ